MPTLSPEREAQILEAYAAHINATWAGMQRPVTADDLRVYTYYGTFNGNSVVSVFGKDWAGTADVKGVTVGGHLIAVLGSGSCDVTVFDGANIVAVEYAYERGMLLEDDLRTMLFQRLRNSYANQLYWDDPRYDSYNYDENLWGEIFDDIIIMNYYGYPEAGDVVTFWHRDTPFNEMSKLIEVAGYEFWLASGNFELLIQSNYFECLSVAYASGAISKAAVAELHARHFA